MAIAADGVMSDIAEARAVCDFLLAEGRVGLVIGPHRSRRFDLLNVAAVAFGGAVFRVANPLASRLSLNRIMVQVDATDDGGDDALLLKAHLASHSTADVPAILMIDDAETLDDEALAALAGLASGDQDMNGARLILAGNPAFEQRLSSPGMEALRNPVTAITVFLQPGDDGEVEAGEELRPLPQTPPPVPPPPPPLTTRVLAVAVDAQTPTHQTAGIPISPLGRRAGVRRRSLGLSLAALLLIAAGVGGLVIKSGHVIQPHVVDNEAKPAETPPTVMEPQVGPPGQQPGQQPGLTAGADALPSQSSSPPQAPTTDVVPVLPLPETPQPRLSSKSEGQLRTEFQDFLTRTGRVALVRDANAFEVLFQGYLRWRSGTEPGGASASPR